MSYPLIGLTTYRNQSIYGFQQFSLSEAYAHSLMDAGSNPVLIPLGLPEANLNTILKRLDGLLLSGGGDIDPERYHSNPHPLVSEVDPDRDRVEIHLFNQALEMDLPVLGICRGMQVINVALGGTLYEDIMDQMPEAIQHRYFPDWPRDFLAHTVAVSEQSRLRDIVEAPSLKVNSLHHQGVDRLAARLKATACAPDGLVEAFELEEYPYCLGVQWHPENLQAHPEMKAVFQSFVSAAGARVQ